MTGRPPSPEDAWSAARRDARSEVAAALAPRRRVCPACGAEQGESATRSCASCGADLVVRRRRRRPGRRRVAISALVVLAILGGIGLFVNQTRRDAERHQRAAAREQARVEGAERARLRRESRPESARLPGTRGGDLAARRRFAVRATERLITRDARARVAAGRLDGPVIGTRCRLEPATETRAALEADPGAVRLPYACVALKARFDVPGATRRGTGLFGHPYRAVVDVPSATATWCRLFPAPSEGASAPATVSLPSACRVRREGD